VTDRREAGNGGVYLSTPGSGPWGTTSGGRPYEIRGPIESTGGSLRLVEISESPRHDALIHVHDFDEAWYVLEGTYAVWVNDGWRSLGPGAFLFVEGGVPHGFAVVGPAAARKLSIALPGPSASFDFQPVETRTVPGDDANQP
jgi:quercetin dioxygenase-like cupin family protein